jgi:hypothetical protein
MHADGRVLFDLPPVIEAARGAGPLERLEFAPLLLQGRSRAAT